MAFNPLKKIIETENKGSKESIEYLFTENFIKNKDYTAFKESETEASLYRWNENHWSRIEFIEARNIALEWLKKSGNTQFYSNNKAKDCINTLTTAIKGNIKDLEKEKIFIPLANYWLDVDATGSINCIAPDRNLKITYCLNLDINIEKIKDGKYFPDKELKKESKWQTFLDSSMPDKNVQKTLQEYIGYTLIPNVDLQVALFCEGEGSNGKGVFFEVVSALHQESKVKSINMEKLDGFGLTPLIDASLIIVPECGKSINEEMFKSIIAGDPVPVNRKNRDEITIKPTAKWLVSCNTLPTIKDQTDGTSRRMICVEWTKQFKEDEKIVGLAKQIIEEELQDVLDWALNGLIDVIKREKRKIFIADAIKNKKEKHLFDTNSVGQWLEYSGLNYSSNVNEYKDKSLIYKNYVEFCEDRFISKKGDVNFWKEIKRTFPNLQEIQKKLNVNGETKRIRCVNIDFEFFKNEVKAVIAPIKIADVDDCPF